MGLRSVTRSSYHLRFLVLFLEQILRKMRPSRVPLATVTERVVWMGGELSQERGFYVLDPKPVTKKTPFQYRVYRECVSDVVATLPNQSQKPPPQYSVYWASSVFAFDLAV